MLYSIQLCCDLFYIVMQYISKYRQLEMSFVESQTDSEKSISGIQSELMELNFDPACTSAGLPWCTRVGTFRKDAHELSVIRKVRRSRKLQRPCAAQGTARREDAALCGLRRLLWNLCILFANNQSEARGWLLLSPEISSWNPRAKAGLEAVVSRYLSSMLGIERAGLERLASPTGFEPVLSP